MHILSKSLKIASLFACLIYSLSSCADSPKPVVSDSNKDSNRDQQREEQNNNDIENKKMKALMFSGRGLS